VRRGGGGFHGGFRGGRAFHGGVRGGRAYAYRGGRAYGWRGRGWRPGWGVAVGAGALAAAPYYYGGYRCPLVRQVVRTRYGLQERWVRRCY